MAKGKRWGDLQRGKRGLLTRGPASEQAYSRVACVKTVVFAEW